MPHPRGRKMRLAQGFATVSFAVAALAFDASNAPASIAAPRHDRSALPRDHAPPHGPVNAQVSVCFVPAQECDTAVVAAIRDAQQSIRVQAYGFTSPMILRELADARARGVDVQAILDKTNDPPERPNTVAREGGQRRSGAAFTVGANIPTWIDDSVTIAHNKIIIIDDRFVIGGSYNYTVSAERHNGENVTFIDSPDAAALYLSNWESRKAVSRQAGDTSQTGDGGRASDRTFLATGSDGD